MVFEFDKHHKRVSPDLSIYLPTSIHLFFYIYIYIYGYISRLHGISCSYPHLEHHSFPDLFVYIYLSTYLHAYIFRLHGISCSDPHLEHHCFESSSLSLSLIPTHEMDCQTTKPLILQNACSWLMVLEFGQHRKRASPDLSIYIYSSISISTYIYIYAYISCLHGISCSDPHLEHHCFEHSSLSQLPTHQMDCQIAKP